MEVMFFRFLEHLRHTHKFHTSPRNFCEDVFGVKDAELTPVMKPKHLQNKAEKPAFQPLLLGVSHPKGPLPPKINKRRC